MKGDDVTFALKVIKKKHVVDNRQQEHIHSERRILAEARSPFVVKSVGSGLWPHHTSCRLPVAISDPFEVDRAASGPEGQKHWLFRTAGSMKLSLYFHSPAAAVHRFSVSMIRV